jgi:6-phosphofructokinase 1
MMPRNFISKDGFGITSRCRTYLEPLIQGEDYPPYQRGLPRYASLKLKPVRKLLDTEFVLE